MLKEGKKRLIGPAKRKERQWVRILVGERGEGMTINYLEKKGKGRVRNKATD